MNFLSNPNFFMWVIIILYAGFGIRQCVELNWPQVLYAIGAVILNYSVIAMGSK